MFCTESEYTDFIQKTKFSRNLGHIIVVLSICGTFLIGLTYGFLIQNIFNAISILWFLFGLSICLLTLRYLLKKNSDNSYIVMSPKEWLLKNHLPTKFWFKNRFFIYIDKRHVYLRAEQDSMSFSYPLIITSTAVIEFICVVVPLTLYLVRPYDLSIYKSLIEYASPIVLLLIIIGLTFSVFLFVFIHRRLVQWTITKHTISDIQLDIRNTNKKRFNESIPISYISSSKIKEHTRREILEKNRYGRSYMKQMSQNWLDAQVYSLEVMIPVNNDEMAKHEQTVPNINYIILQNMPKDLVEDLQEILSVWTQI